VDGLNEVLRGVEDKYAKWNIAGGFVDVSKYGDEERVRSYINAMRENVDGLNEVLRGVEDEDAYWDIAIGSVDVSKEGDEEKVRSYINAMRENVDGLNEVLRGVEDGDAKWNIAAGFVGVAKYGEQTVRDYIESVREVEHKYAKRWIAIGSVDVSKYGDEERVRSYINAVRENVDGLNEVLRGVEDGDAKWRIASLTAKVAGETPRETRYFLSKVKNLSEEEFDLIGKLGYYTDIVHGIILADVYGVSLGDVLALIPETKEKRSLKEEVKRIIREGMYVTRSSVEEGVYV